MGASADADTSLSVDPSAKSADAWSSAEEDATPRGSGRGRKRRGAQDSGWGQAQDPDSSRKLAPDKSDDEWASEGRAVMLRQLALGPRSRHQLGMKLAERDVPAPIVQALLDRFEEVQLIDDAEFARMWVRTRTAARSLARSSIRRELAEKGVDPELAENALLQISDEDEHDQARDIVRRKLRGSVDLSERTVRDKEIRRLVGVLARKGYSPGASFRIVKDVIAEAEGEG